MTSTYFSIVLLIIYFVVNEHEGVPIIDQTNRSLLDSFSQTNKLPSFINRTQQIVDQLRCSKGWKQFGGSCYYPSLMISTVDKANETCQRLQVNNTHLMRIKHVPELSYAAHLYATNTLIELLVEVDPELLKSKALGDRMLTNEHRDWRMMKDQFYRALVNSKHHDKSFNLRNTIITNASREKNDMFERLDQIHDLCYQFAWNVLSNDSHLFVFSTYILSNKTICSLSDVDLNSTYTYACQYVLDFCFENVMCGNHGKCNNTIQGFICSCSFWFGGVFCEKPWETIQMSIAAVLIVTLTLILFTSKVVHGMKSMMKRIAKCCKSQRADVNRPNDNKNRTKKAKLRRQRSIGVFFLFLIFFCLLIIIPTIFQLQAFSFDDIDPMKPDLLFDKVLSIFKTCERKTLLPMIDRIFLAISVFLTITFFVLQPKPAENSSPSNSFKLKEIQPTRNNVEMVALCSSLPAAAADNSEQQLLLSDQSRNDTTRSTNRNDPFSGTTTPLQLKLPSSGLPSLCYPIDIKNRYQTAAIFGILTFEILLFFDEVLLAISGTSNDGVMIIFLKRIFLAILIGLRYYPLLLALRLQQTVAQLMAFIYVIGIIAHTIYRESFCLDFLPHSADTSTQEEVQLRLQIGTWFIVYGLIAHLPHFMLLSYIAAEFGMRFVFTCRSIYPKDYEKKVYSKPIQVSNDTQHDDGSFFDKIYKWNDDFSFTSMFISTYTVNFIILYHLSCTFTFLYTTRLMSPTLFIINTLEQLFSIEINDKFFHEEIIFSVFITAATYIGQLILGMKSFREHILAFYKEKEEIVNKIEENVKENETISRATQYPGYLIRYTVGGFVITFHLMIFVAVLPRLFWFHSSSFKWVLQLILPILILYALQKLMAKSSTRLIDAAQDKRSDYKKLFVNILQYFVLVANCFIGIMSSVIRVIMGSVANIIFINRVDLCLFRDPLERMDRAYVAYLHFVHVEYHTKYKHSHIQEIEDEEQVESTNEEELVNEQSSEPSESEPDQTEQPSNEEPAPHVQEASDVSNPLPDDINPSILPIVPERSALSASSSSRDVNERQLLLLQRWNEIKNERVEENRTLVTEEKQLSRIQCKRVSIRGDGNCFFRAISAQLNIRHNHSNIRSEAVNYLRSRRDYFASFIVGIIRPTVDAYIKEMAHNGVYADHPIIFATATVLGQNIVIHEIGKRPLLIPGSDNINNQLHVWYNGIHYDSIVTSDGRHVPNISRENLLTS
ncbi:unnamed protein product [Adineta ricciae]|uniref:Ubiquitinyl hydrolase 1 n=1 Tax=Adineta ricciae TaxID=249248 RepID=A0A813PJR3_ADIRI|nr:unnamed protein product [Adineta ricciae]